MDHTPTSYDTVLVMLDSYARCIEGPVHRCLEEAGTSPDVLERLQGMIVAEFSLIEERNNVEHPQRQDVFSRARTLGLDWLLVKN